MKKSQLAIILSLSLIVVAGGLSLVIFKDFRTGLFHTIGTAVNDTASIFSSDDEKAQADSGGVLTLEDAPSEDIVPPDATPLDDANLHIYLPNTGGDFIIAIDGGEAVLINSSYASDYEVVKKYMDNLGIKKFRYVVATDPAKSSTEGMAKILSYKSTDYLLMAHEVEVSKNTAGLIKQIKDKKQLYTVPRDNAQFKFGASSFRVIGNNYDGNVSVLIENKGNSFLFAGSLKGFETATLEHMPKEVDVLSVTQPDKNYQFPLPLLERVNPKNVILNDKDGLDSSEVVKRITSQENTLYKETASFNIVIGSNGKDITITADK